ncbi:hypothetical protein CDL12_00367 [Handroanthus impetiginosus]|uniref:Uncharacterized protein n=1 Tax=Handroanthus impetiginosus TaxID=429701 RepID=A0A2G9IAV0_9LAMI|nr:hypothetical protein CDL12_00367 [Handroanthus impetiginosus]
MAASALANFTLFSHRCMNHSKISQPTTPNPFKTRIFISSSLSSIRYNRQQPVRKLHVSSKPSLLPISPPPQKNISKFFVGGIATLLLASLVFMGCLKSTPVLANPVQESESVEDKGGAQSESSDREEEVVCVKLLEEDQENIEALKMVVNVKMRRGKTNEAVEYVEKLIELQPNEMEWRLLQALCYEMMGNLGKARSLFKDILKQQPLLLRALHGLAMVMHKNREGPAVFAMLDKALGIACQEKRVDEERNIRILVAQMHLIKGNLVEALERFQDLIDENPRDFRPYLCQGIVYRLMDKRKEAEESFEIYQSLVPEEFPQRGFLDDVVLEAKMQPKEKLEKELRT